MSTSIGGSAAPLLGVALMRQTGSTWPVGLVLVVAELRAIGAFLRIRETKDRDPDAGAPSVVRVPADAR